MNSLYDSIRVQLATGAFDWRAQALQLVAWFANTTFVPTDTTVGQIKARGGIVVGSSLAVLGNAVAADGSVQTGPVVIPGIPVTQVVTKLTLVKTNAVPDSRALVLFLDDVLGLPYTSNGLDMVVTPDWSLNRGWFKP